MYAAEAKDNMIIDSHIQKIGVSGLLIGAFIGFASPPTGGYGYVSPGTNVISGMHKGTTTKKATTAIDAIITLASSNFNISPSQNHHHTCII
jgi:hypothetical protein